MHENSASEHSDGLKDKHPVRCEVVLHRAAREIKKKLYSPPISPLDEFLMRKCYQKAGFFE